MSTLFLCTSSLELSLGMGKKALFIIEEIKDMYEKLKGCIPNIPKIYYILYRTDNLANRKFYYGVHATNKIEDGYLGSGKVLKKAISKYGKESFVRTNLEFFDTMEEAYRREAEIVTEELIKDPDCYNAKPGGLGGLRGMTTIYFQGEYQKVPISSLEEYLTLGAEHKSRNRGKPSPLKGRKQSEEHLKHRSEALKGHKGYPGRKKPEGFGEKIRQARLGAKGNTVGRKSIWKDGQRMLVRAEEVPGWVEKGWLRTEEYRCLVRDGELPIVVPRKDISKFFKLGYRKTTFEHIKEIMKNGTE